MGRANTFPIPLIWLDIDWDLSWNSGKQKAELVVVLTPECLLLLASPSPLSFQWLAFLNLEFFARMRVFSHNGYKHSPNMYSFLPCRQQLEIQKHQAGDKSSGKPFRRGCLWDPQVQFKMDCTVLANVGLPFEGTKGNYCMAWEPYSVLLWESL